MKNQVLDRKKIIRIVKELEEIQYETVIEKIKDSMKREESEK